jgi:hypothetical protein
VLRFILFLGLGTARAATGTFTDVTDGPCLVAAAPPTCGPCSAMMRR